jgi:hypothetical protein
MGTENKRIQSSDRKGAGWEKPAEQPTGHQKPPPGLPVKPSEPGSPGSGDSTPSGGGSESGSGSSDSGS